jgi:hypothetical protein
MSTMDTLTTRDFLHELAAYKGKQVLVRVMGAGTSETGDPTGVEPSLTTSSVTPCCYAQSYPRYV